ncbi:glutathione synthase [Neocallimastix lanati (nom. inval.)]|nr:glutathione synthase [Neocallimastix sp. JGI-2020a]
MASNDNKMNTATKNSIIRHAIDWALAHGLNYRVPVTFSCSTQAIPEPIKYAATHAPFALTPAPFPKVCFQKAKDLQPVYNELFHNISRDKEFIDSAVKSLGNTDSFITNLYDIYQKVQSEGLAQSITLGIHRSDYMVHNSKNEQTLQQVEFNTIASSFSSLSYLTSELHRYLAKSQIYPESCKIDEKNIPFNDSFLSIANGIAKAHELYGIKDAIILMVVQPNERNAFDQRWIEYNLFEKHGLKLIRKSLAEIQEEAILEGPDKKLIVDGHEISVAYFRAGYTPNDYPSDVEWQARLKIERSKAVKCPNIAYHLSGTKKIQQMLAIPGNLERFIKDQEKINFIRSSFTGLYAFDQSEVSKKALARLAENPDDFVMKPQREGGGNNIYGKDIPPFLSKLSDKEKEGYILMDLIRPEVQDSTIIRDGKAEDFKVISELGIYGIYLSNAEDQSVINTQGGYLLRTKSSTSNEGGVASGYGCLNSPLLQ